MVFFTRFVFFLYLVIIFIHFSSSSYGTEKINSQYWHENDPYFYALIDLKYCFTERIKDRILSIKKERVDKDSGFFLDHENDSSRFSAFIDKLINTVFSSKKLFKNQQDRYVYVVELIRFAQSTFFYKENIKKNPSLEVQNFYQMLQCFYNEVSLTTYGVELINSLAKIGGAKEDEISAEHFNFLDLSFDQQVQFSLGRIYYSILRLGKVYNGLGNAPLRLKIPYEKLPKQLWQKFVGMSANIPMVKFDPDLDGHVITNKYILENDQGEKHYAIRMPTATIGHTEEEVEMAPEFRSYIHSLKYSQKKHVYINLQDRREPTKLKTLGLQDERPRCCFLEGLNYTKDLKENLMVITLPHNSDFYNQHGEVYGRDYIEKNYFSKILFHMMFESKNDNGFYFPADWQKENAEFALWIKDLLKNFNENFFKDKSNLSLKERRLYIDMVYFFITQYAIKGTFSSNRSCKDAVDRAGARHYFEYIFLSLMEIIDPRTPFSKEELSKREALIPSMLLSDALLFKQRAIKPERIKRGLEVSTTLVLMVKKNPERFHSLRNFLSFSKLKINYGIKEQKVNDPRFKFPEFNF